MRFAEVASLARTPHSRHSRNRMDLFMHKLQTSADELAVLAQAANY